MVLLLMLNIPKKCSSVQFDTRQIRMMPKKKSIMKKKIKLGCVVSSSELQVVTCFIQ